jgi:DNA-binding MarR family transcriptional regulator
MENASSSNLKRYNHLIGEIEATYHEASLKLGISDSVSMILYTICNAGGSCLLNDICKQTGLSKQTVHSAIRKLEAQDFINLIPVGGKAKKVVFTEKGAVFAKSTALRLIEIENNIFASWSQEDVQKYLELTERFLLYLKDRVKTL